MALLEWALPAPLEGVKSRKRPIFQVMEGAELPLDQGALVVSVSGAVQLTLGSRVAAASGAGHTVTSILLGEAEPLSGRVFRSEGLRVAHLGPHLCSGPGATAEGLAAAVAASLAPRPQVVVLDEAPGAPPGGPWPRAFRRLLRSEALRGFRGAVVVRAAAETPALRRACAEHWAVVGGRLWQLEAAAAEPEATESEPEEPPAAVVPAAAAAAAPAPGPPAPAGAPRPPPPRCAPPPGAGGA